MAITMSGSGTEEKPYIVTTGKQLTEIQLDPTAYFQLDRSIDLTEVCNDSDGTGWTPITNFSGTLDGNGFMIRNLFINRNKDNQALFATTRGATIMNFGLIDVNITGNSVNCAPVISNMTSYDDVLKNVFVTGSVFADTNCSGLVGTMNGGTIKNCYSNVTVNCTNTSSANGAGFVYEMKTDQCRISKSAFNGKLIATNPQPYVVTNNGGHIEDANLYNHYNKTNNSQGTHNGGYTDDEMKTKSNFSNWLDEYYNADKPVWSLTEGQYPKLFFEVTTKYIVSFESNGKTGFYYLGKDKEDNNKRKWLQLSKDKVTGDFPTASEFELYGMTDNDLTAISRFEWNQLRELTDEFELLASTDKYVVNRTIKTQDMTKEQELTDAIVLSTEIDFASYGDSINQIKILQ